MTANPGQPGCALAGHGPSLQCGGTPRCPSLLPRDVVMGRDCSALPRSRNGISPPSRAVERGCEPGMSRGWCFSPWPWDFLWVQGFSPPPLFKLPFANTFCFFPLAPAKLLSTKGVTK